jgi:hypothetical protein
MKISKINLAKEVYSAIGVILFDTANTGRISNDAERIIKRELSRLTYVDECIPTLVELETGSFLANRIISCRLEKLENLESIEAKYKLIAEQAIQS